MTSLASTGRNPPKRLPTPPRPYHHSARAPRPSSLDARRRSLHSLLSNRAQERASVLLSPSRRPRNQRRPQTIASLPSCPPTSPKHRPTTSRFKNGRSRYKRKRLNKRPRGGSNGTPPLELPIPSIGILWEVGASRLSQQQLSRRVRPTTRLQTKASPKPSTSHSRVLTLAHGVPKLTRLMRLISSLPSTQQRL